MLQMMAIVPKTTITTEYGTRKISKRTGEKIMMNNFMNNGATNNNGKSNNGGFIMATGAIKTMEVFADIIKQAMEVHYGEGYKVEIHKVVKNNDIHLTGLTILDKKNNVAPNIYLEQYFKMCKDGMSMADICMEIISVYENYKVETRFDVASVTDFNRVKDRICYKLINAEYNKEMLSDTPHIKFYDLAIIFYIVVSNDGSGLATVTVKKPLMEFWNVSKEKLFELAVENTQRLFEAKVESLADKMVDMIAAELDEESVQEFYDMMAEVDNLVPMHVCSNTSYMNGAGTIFYDGLLKKFAEQVNSNVYIIPSSIHEVLFIPAKYRMSARELKDMVRSVNSTELPPEEILSDNVYYYSRKLDRVEMM